MSSIVILGRQPELSLAELERCYGAPAIKATAGNWAVIDAQVDLKRLGGSLKAAELKDQLKYTSLPQLWRRLEKIAGSAARGQTGKFNLGLSVYGDPVLAHQLQRQLLSLKRALRSQGVASRIVPAGPDGTLNTAKVWHNRLDRPGALELVVIVNDQDVMIGQTYAVQDINAFTNRDRNKPVRDARVGMLPPKLARLMINLAQPEASSLILDPFCGTGTVLMEALELGYNATCSDLDPRMVKATQSNLDWYKADHDIEPTIGDARQLTWSGQIGAVVTETYLGPPMTEVPTPPVVHRFAQEIGELVNDTLKNLAEQLKPGTPVCLAVPAWFLGQQPIRLSVVDDLEKLGYNPVDLKHADQPLIYRRPDQVVGRELLILTRK